MSLFVRFERGRDNVVGPTMGPFPFVQLTYEELRIGPSGDLVAMVERGLGTLPIAETNGHARRRTVAVVVMDGDWIIGGPGLDHPACEPARAFVGGAFTDIIIWEVEQEQHQQHQQEQQQRKSQGECTAG
jgi:hypothetical protein